MPPLMEGQNICGCIPLRSRGHPTGVRVHHRYKGSHCAVFCSTYGRRGSIELKRETKASLMGGSNPADPWAKVSDSFFPKIFSL